MRRKEKNNKNLKKIIIILSLIFIILYSMQAVKTFSIYVYNNVREFYLKSNNFYFYSDKLKLNKAEYSAKNWSGIEDYIININMNSMENNSVRCNSDIEYTISYTCSDNILCQLSKTKSTIYASDNVDNFIVTITPKAELQTGDVVWLEVEATSTYPYVKTISGRFEITVGNLGMSYNIEDSKHSQYLEFNVVNTLNFYTIDEAFDGYVPGNKIDMNKYLALSDENKSKCHSMLVTLTFDPKKVLVDMTSEVYLKRVSTTTVNIDGYTYVNSITFKVDAISSKCVKFYKVNLENDYTYPNVNNEPIINISYI